MVGESKLIVLSILSTLIYTISSSKFDEDIIIVGAGSSGYAAACKLLENGFNNVRIFEAENRIGGRTYTKLSHGFALDMGAQWIHGESGNVIYELASTLNLTKNSIVDVDKVTFVTSNGDIINEGIGQSQFEFFYNLIESNDEFGKSTEKIGDFVSKHYRDYVEKTKPFNESSKEEAISQFLRYFESYIGTYTAMSDWNLDNGIGYSSYKDCEGNPAISWKDGGYANIFNILKNKLQNPLAIDERIFLNQKIVSINWNDEKVIVEDQNGTSYAADKVIVTVPLGVLKEKSDQLFLPTLPAKLNLAIKTLGFGTVFKIFLIYEERWWSDEVTHLLWTNQDIENLPPEEKWMSTITAFSSVDNAPTVLSLWYYGNKDISLVENQSDESVKVSVLKLLRKIFKRAIPDPIGMERSNWHAQENFRGSYSYRGLFAYENNITNADLSEPLRNSKGEIKVLFAGEATSPNHYGTVHGAIESGWATANLIIADATSSEE